MNGLHPAYAHDPLATQPPVSVCPTEPKLKAYWIRNVEIWGAAHYYKTAHIQKAIAEGCWPPSK